MTTLADTTVETNWINREFIGRSCRKGELVRVTVEN